MTRGTALRLPFFVALFGVFFSADSAALGKTKILYLGDSLSIGAFGQTLDSSMRASGFEVHTVVAGGASPYYWLKEYQPLPCTIGFWEKSPTGERRLGYVRAVPKIEDLIDDMKPNVVVVQTGINLYATLRSKRRAKSDNVAEVSSLIEQMCYAISKGGAVSYWVLPPSSHEKRYPVALQEELSSIMRSIVYKYEGQVFESRKVTEFVDPYPATDGIHYGPEEARGWATKVSSHFNDYMRVSKPKIEAPHSIVRAVPLSPVRRPSSSQSTARTSVGGSNAPLDEVILDLKLVEKSSIENLSDLDYANALGIFEYEVLSDTKGNYPFDRIRVAHGIVFNRKHTSAANREIGSTIELNMVPLSKYRTLSTWQVVDDLRPNFEMPIYTPRLD
ncbi:hypothetical protein VSU19_13530 [Verrucomicrobiales bacterium BCK34]|nr:hypothetical protein [Verrucomicrobiales bacterium BCK34]